MEGVQHATRNLLGQRLDRVHAVVQLRLTALVNFCLLLFYFHRSCLFVWKDLIQLNSKSADLFRFDPHYQLICLMDSYT